MNRLSLHNPSPQSKAEYIEEHRSTRYVVETAGPDHSGLIEYSKFGFGPWDNRPEMHTAPAEWPKDASIDAVIADLVKHFHSRWPSGYADADDRKKMGDGLDGRDLTVWRNGRLLAAIVADPEGNPVVTRF